jgi:hypothetical protein
MNDRVDTRPRGGSGPSRLRLGAILAVAIAAGLLAFILISGDDDDDSDGGAKAASVEDLQASRDDSGHKVYWAGRRGGQAYELTETSGGNIFIRYLPSEDDVGAKRPDFLTVGTYPFRNAYETLEKLSRREGAISRQIEGGGLIVAREPQALNVYFAYPNDNLQVEVYDPRPGRALRLATSGQVRPIP